MSRPLFAVEIFVLRLCATTNGIFTNGFARELSNLARLGYITAKPFRVGDEWLFQTAIVPGIIHPLRAHYESPKAKLHYSGSYIRRMNEIVKELAAVTGTPLDAFVAVCPK